MKCMRWQFCVTVLGGWGWSLDGHVWGLWWPFGYAFGRPRRAVAKVAGGSTGAAQGRRLWGPGLLVRGESKAQDFGKGDIWVSAKRSVCHFSCTEFTPQHQVLFSTPCAAPTESLLFGAVVQNGGFPADTIASRYTNVHAHPMSRAGWICLRVQSGTVDRAACVTIRHR